MKSEMNWERLALRVREAKKSIDALQAFLEESEGFFRDGDEIDKPVIEPQAAGLPPKIVDYDSVDITNVSERMNVPILIGMKEDGNPLVVDLSRLPHLLVSGTVGTGKTTFLSTMLYGFQKRFTPEEMRLVLYDEKRVEYTWWSDSPYLYRPVVYDAKTAFETLRDLDSEMKMRFEILNAAGCRNIQAYNAASSCSTTPERRKMPYIMFVADEIAELMLIERKRALPIILRLTAVGRAAGIHLVLATSRPSHNIVSVQLKANIPGRIAFKMCSEIDSRQILDVNGAQNLAGRGDLLFMDGGGDLVRAQGASVSDEMLSREIKKHLSKLNSNSRYP